LLLFQVLKDDFLSLTVRGCWLVSFFFTPIYMLALLFIVLFGPKKGTLTTYSSYWSWEFKNYATLLFNKFISTFKDGNLALRFIKYDFSTIRFQLIVVTSRLTVYILFFFWLFFFFFGDTFLSVLLNYNTLSEVIPSSYFLVSKEHTLFMLVTSTSWLSDSIFFYIITLTTLSIMFLLNMRYTFTYNYYSAVYLFDVLVLSSFLVFCSL
jgi:hypothetical protein